MTRSNPTHQPSDPTQLNPLQVKKIGLNPVQLTIRFSSDFFIRRTYLVLLVNRASTYSCSLLIIADILVLLLHWTRPDPTERMGQPNPCTTPILHRGVLAAVERALVGRRVRQNGRATPHACPR